jgi:hypothetical protein
MSQKLLNTRNKSSLRIPSVDIFRGLTLLLMIDAHIPMSVKWMTKWADILAAPFFLIIAGLSYDLFLSSEKRKKIDEKYKNIEVLSRGLLIYSLPLVPYIIIGITFTIPFIQLPVQHYSVQIIHWSVFQVIGAGYVLGIFIPNTLKSKIFSVILVFISTYIISYFHISGFYFLINDIYAFLPWIGYFLCGRIFYELYNRSLKNETLVGFSLLLSILSLLILNIFKTNFLSSSRNQFPMFLFISTIGLIMFTLMIIFIDRRLYYNNFLNLLGNIGKISFTSYYIHFPILFFITFAFKMLFGSVNPFEYSISIVLNLFILLLVISILYYIEHNWRKYNYLFGFEWFTRIGSQILTKFAAKMFL